MKNIKMIVDSLLGVAEATYEVCTDEIEKARMNGQIRAYSEILSHLESTLVLVETGDFIIRDNIQYQVVIADENIFVICECSYNKKEKSFVTNYEISEIYSNLFDLNSLKDLKMELIWIIIYKLFINTSILLLKCCL